MGILRRKNNNIDRSQSSTLYVRAAKAPVRLHRCAGSSESCLSVKAVGTKISRVGSIFVPTYCFLHRLLFLLFAICSLFLRNFEDFVGSFSDIISLLSYFEYFPPPCIAFGSSI